MESIIKKMFDLSGRTAFVAGGCGNIGRSLCSGLASHGANVIIADLDSGGGEILDRLKAETNGNHELIQADLSTEAGISEAMRLCAHHQCFDIVVHAIGIISSVPVAGYAVDFDKQTPEAWRYALEVNLTSAFLLAKAVHTKLQKSKSGSMIFLSSIYGCVGPNWSLYEDTGMGNPIAYGASKGGIQQLMMYLATNWAPNVRVNCVSPGGIRRNQPEPFVKRYEELTPLRRMADPEDIAGPVVFLAADASRYITGQNILVDGGWTAW